MNKPEPVSMLISYAHEDEPLRKQLQKHLSLLQRQGLVSAWQDRQITAGTHWAQEIDEHLKSASIILLLVSADFLASDYCYGIEMQRALERDEAGQAKVIPIVLRPCDWKDAPFARLQALPTDAYPITKWPDRDDAWADVVAGLRRVIKQLPPLFTGQSTPSTPSTPPSSPESQPRSKRIAIIVGIGLLLLLLIGAGVFTRFYYLAPSHNPYTLNMGMLVLNDPLHDNSQGYKWDETPASSLGGTCGFIAGAYHSIAANFDTTICRPGAANTDFSDLTYEVKITIYKGDIGGIVFRDNPTTNFSYVFTVDVRGNYTLSKDDGSGHLSTLRSGTNVAIDNGPVASNLLAVVATGDMISLYANNTQLVAQVQDSSYKRGQIGIYVIDGSDVIAS